MKTGGALYRPTAHAACGTAHAADDLEGKTVATFTERLVV